jgi:translation elongation factor EF-4
LSALRKDVTAKLYAVMLLVKISCWKNKEGQEKNGAAWQVDIQRSFFGHFEKRLVVF